MGNSYEEKTIPVRVASGTKYRVDSVAYDWSRFFTYDYKAEWVYSIIVDNTQATDTTWAHIRPYEKAVRRVRFSIQGEVMGKDYYTTILGAPLPEVPIPDVVDGKPLLRDTRVTFDPDEQDLPVDLDKNFTVLVPVPGGKKMEVGAYVSVEYYDVPFVIHCSHPYSGRTRTFSGTLSSDRPYDYFYIRTELQATPCAPVPAVGPGHRASCTSRPTRRQHCPSSPDPRRQRGVPPCLRLPHRCFSAG